MSKEVMLLLNSSDTLTQEEETIVFKEYTETIDEELKLELRNAIVMKNMGLVKKVSSYYINYEFDTEELKQEGVFGLITAVNKFDYTSGYKFSTYACHWIKQAMTRYMNNHRNIIRLPVHVSEILFKINRIKNFYIATYQEEPSTKYIANELDIPEEKVIFYLNQSNIIDPISLNAQVRNKDNSEETEFMELLTDSTSLNVEDAVMENENSRILHSVVNTVLNDRERQVVILRYGLDNGGIPRTLDEVGQNFGLTRERIRQIEKNALRKLRHSKLTRAVL